MNLQCFGHLMGRANSLEKTLMLGKIEGRRRRGRQKMRWFDGHEFEQALGDDGQGSLACCSPWGHRVGQDLVTEQQQRELSCGCYWVSCAGKSERLP